MSAERLSAAGLLLLAGAAFVCVVTEAQPAQAVRSKISIYSLATKSAEVVYTADRHIEAPNWSPDGTQILFMCRRGGPDFEICVMNADGTGQSQMTFNEFFEGTATWSPDGQQIVFNRTLTGQLPQLFVMNANGTGETQLTFPPGLNLLATSWEKIEIGEYKDHDKP